MRDPCSFSLSLEAHNMPSLLLVAHIVSDIVPGSLAFLTKISDDVLIARMCRWKLATRLHFS
jgi:hypothetical protein